MKRMIFQADEELLDRLRRHARDHGVSVAEVIRRAVEREVGSASERRLRFIGAIDSGPSDLSERAADDEFEAPGWH